MEIMTLSGRLHDEAPIDLTTTSSRLRHHTPIMLTHRAPWQEPLNDPSTTSLPSPQSSPPSAPSRPSPSPSMPHYIPIPKKRHLAGRNSPPTSSTATPPSPPLDACDTPEVARKRPRYDTPSDVRQSCKDEGVSVTSTRGGVEDWMVGGMGGHRTDKGDVSQSAMWPRHKRQTPPKVQPKSARVEAPRDDPLEGDTPGPNNMLLNTLMQMQAGQLSPQTLPPALKDTEALLTAIHQSQMLYYSYCSQLLHNLRTKQTQQPEAQQPRRPHQAKLHRHLSTGSSHDDLHDDDDDEYVDVTDDDRVSSILRTRLNPQEHNWSPSPLRSPSQSPNGAQPSSTITDDLGELSPCEGSGGARKRAPRALTGKHVRPGTGASATTLLTLRQKLEERQKHKDVQGAALPQHPSKGKPRGKKR